MITQLKDIFDQLNIYSVTLMMMQRVGGFADTNAAGRGKAEQEKLNANLAMIDIQRTIFESKYSISAGCISTFEDTLLSYLMESDSDKIKKCITKVKSVVDDMEFCTEQDLERCHKILYLSSEAREQFDRDKNFVDFIYVRTNTLKELISTIESQFSDSNQVVDATIADDKDVKHYKYDVEYLNKIITYCENDVFLHIRPDEIHLAASTADFSKIYPRANAHNKKKYILYIIALLSNRMVEGKEWCHNATKSIGYESTFATKWKGDLIESWLSGIDRIK